MSPQVLNKRKERGPSQEVKGERLENRGRLEKSTKLGGGGKDKLEGTRGSKTQKSEQPENEILVRQI